MILDGLETLDIDDATDKKIREALRETIADSRPESSSLALQVVCKLLEEPNMHFKGTVREKEMRYYGHRHALAKQVGLTKLMKVTLSTYRWFVPSRRPTRRLTDSVSIVRLKTVEKLEHANAQVLAAQLCKGRGNSPPPHTYDPESRLAALWLITKLPKVHKSTGRFSWRKLTVIDDGTPIEEEMRYVNQS